MMKAPTESISLFPEPKGDEKRDALNPVDQSSQLLSRGSTTSGHDEEAVVYNYTRMLQDPTGRLCMLTTLDACALRIPL